MKNNMVAKAVDTLSSKMVANGGRWCEIKIKSTGKVLRVIRTGYGSMECPENDSAILKDGYDVIYESNDLYEMAEFILENYR